MCCRAVVPRPRTARFWTPRPQATRTDRPKRHYAPTAQVGPALSYLWRVDMWWVFSPLPENPPE